VEPKRQDAAARAAKLRTSRSDRPVVKFLEHAQPAKVAVFCTYYGMLGATLIFRDQLLSIVRTRAYRLASALVLVLALVLPFLLLNSTTTRAYAVEETLNALVRVKTVHMAGEFHRQGKFECWMRFENNADEPAYLWLVLPRIPDLQRVCTPELSYRINPRTKALFQCRRDERKQDWIIRFSSFFSDTVEAAEKGGESRLGGKWTPKPGGNGSPST
jgi:hypothetical protein